jgi:uncharacterized membrane protein HdeD (DUF308 family)
MAATGDDWQGAARDIWYALLVAGLLTIGLGIFFIASPHETLKVFTVIAGIFLLVDGGAAVLGALFGKSEQRGTLALVGILSLIAGLVLVKKPFQTLTVLVLILGVWFVVAGIARLFFAFTVPEGRAGNILVAILDVIAGIVILSWPDLGLSTLAVIVGIVLLFRGAFLSYGAWRLLKLEREPRGPGTPAPA